MTESKQKQDKKGVVLLIVIGTVFIVIFLANVVLNIITSHSRLTHHQVSRIQAYYASMAGINYALEMLRIGSPTGWTVNPVNSCPKDTPCQLASLDPNFSTTFPLSVHNVNIILTPPQDTDPNKPCYKSTCVSATADYAYIIP